MARIADFNEYLMDAVDKHIYVIGGQHTIATEAWIKRKESGINERNALKLYNKRKSQGIDPVYADDCSGLGMYWLLNNAKDLYPKDITAHGMMGHCDLICKEACVTGAWCFKRYVSGKAHHIGYIVDAPNSYRGMTIVSSRGRAYGVVTGEGGWNAWGIPDVFRHEIMDSIPFVRNLKKGMKAPDVWKLQRLLIANGAKISADGNYGSGTRKAVISAQERYGLSVDGIAGKDTITALGGIWAG